MDAPRPDAPAPRVRAARVRAARVRAARVRAARAFGVAAFLFALAYTVLMPTPMMGLVHVHDGIYPLLWIGGVGVPPAALGSPARGAVGGLAVTAAAVALGVLLVALVATRHGGLLGQPQASNPAGFEVSPSLVFQSVWPDVVLLLPALPFGAAAGAVFVRLARRGGMRTEA